MCSANQLTGFFMMATLAFNELNNTCPYYPLLNNIRSCYLRLATHRNFVCCLKQKYLLQVDDLTIYRSSRLQMFFKIGAFKNFAIFTEKHLC